MLDLTGKHIHKQVDSTVGQSLLDVALQHEIDWQFTRNAFKRVGRGVHEDDLHLVNEGTNQHHLARHKFCVQTNKRRFARSEIKCFHGRICACGELAPCERD